MIVRLASLDETDQARALRRGTLLDVRNPDEFHRGHIDGAVLMPLHLVPLRASELDRRETYYVVCESGARSAQACSYLAQQGYDVRSVEGGMSSWRAAGQPVSTGREQVAPW
ncbi:MAG: rhodanese-like domain-containing protein [Frankiales bacterium]|nr:rhodanese-like domain-containing protein [Frankiales bacterium]